ncbi:MAG: D-aminoacylase [Candidatus Moraniibacteriota bacterium]
MLDILIRNGKVVDGSGKYPPKRLDVGVKNGEIVELGNLEEETASREINAEGKIVAPGFIDINNHSDTHWTLFKYPDQESLVMQGVTTIIGGNCGSSLAPILGEGSIKTLRKWISLRDVQVDWDRMKEFLEFLEDSRPLRLNFGTLVGHATLRRGLIGDEIRPLEEDELAILKRELERSFHEGGFGLSTGLAYTHARVAENEEIWKLAEIVKQYKGILTIHLRGESDELIASVREATELALSTGVNLEISHLKAVGKKSWHLFKRALEIIQEARNSGANINFDVYPYSSSGPVLYTLLPNWVTEGGREKLLKLLRDKPIRNRVIAEMKGSNLNYAKIIIASSPLSKLLVNKSIEDIAEARITSPEEVIVDLVLASEDLCTVIVKLLGEKNVEKALADPAAIISSDGIGYGISEVQSGNLVHPRCFGAFPRFLSHYVKQKEIVSLSKAIHKITGLPARKLGLPNRGFIQKGFRADLVVLDWDNLKDLATLEKPFKYSEGVEEVIVNGIMTVDKGGMVPNVRSGEILRKA